MNIFRIVAFKEIDITVANDSMSTAMNNIVFSMVYKWCSSAI